MAQGSSRFETTLWTDVLLAAREPDSSGGRRALERLCTLYWYPIYAFVRRRGASPDDAKDLTQSFFAHILSHQFLERADPNRGRFRSFLLGALHHHLANEWERSRAQRRGGGAERVSIDETLAEHWLQAEPTSGTDAARAFDRSWAVALLNHVLAALEAEQVAAGKGALFAELKRFLQTTAEPGEYERIGQAFGMNRGVVAVTVHRLNERFGELFRKGVRDTVASPEQAEEELRSLQAALRER